MDKDIAISGYILWFRCDAVLTSRAFSATKYSVLHRPRPRRSPKLGNTSVGGRGHEWFDEELSERRVSYESAVVPELPVDAVERDASASDDLAGNDAVCSTCPSPPT